MSGGYHPWSKFNAHRWSDLNARRQLSNMTEQNVAVIDQKSTMVDYLDAVVTRMRKAVMQYGG